MPYSKHNFRRSLHIEAIVGLLLLLPLFVKAQDNKACQSMIDADKNSFVDAYYFSTALTNHFDKKHIDSFFTREQVLDSIESLNKSTIPNLVAKYDHLSPKQKDLLHKLYGADTALQHLQKRHDMEMEDMLMTLYKHKEYKHLITQYFTLPSQSIYSIDLNLGSKIYDQFLCYAVLYQINIPHLKIYRAD